MIITSRFSSSCLKCGKGIRAGERVSWIKGRKGAEHAACSSEGQETATAVAASRAEVSDLAVPAPPGLAYLAYQRAGVAYAIARLQRPGGTKGVIIADEMGLGKTVQLVGTMNADDRIQTTLIICPKSLTINWERELTKWLVTPRKISRAGEPGWHTAAVVIASYEQAKKYQKELESRYWDLVGLDEAHKIKNSTRALTAPERARADADEAAALARGEKLKVKRRKPVQRTAAAQSLIACGERVMLLTGTPLENRPKELFNLLALADPATWDPKGGGKGFFRFGIKYCNGRKERVSRTREVWKFDGSSNEAELQERMRASCLIRRLKKDVLKELPPKRRQIIEIECDDARMLRLEAAELGLGPDSTADEYAAVAARLQGSSVSFAGMGANRILVGLKKAPAVAEMVRDLLEGGTPKVLIGAHHHQVIDALAAELAEFSFVVITGKNSAAERQAAVDRFQNDPTCRGLIGQIDAAGVGLTLTAGDTCVMAELPYTPGQLNQFEDRLHRIGQTKSVNVYHVVYEGSVDAHFVKMLVRKQDTADAVLDNKPAPPPEPRDTAPPTLTPAQAMLEVIAMLLTPEDRERLHGMLRRLAGMCDGANRVDGAGFNKLDTRLGKELAAAVELTPRQAGMAFVLCRKYSRQLHDMGFDAILSRMPPPPAKEARPASTDDDAAEPWRDPEFQYGTPRDEAFEP